MPLVFVFYITQLGLPEMSVLLIALKQSVNGVFNVVIANLLMGFTWLRILLLPKTESGSTENWTMRSSIENILSAFIFLPLIASMVVFGQGTKERIERDSQHKAFDKAENAARQIEAALTSKLSLLRLRMVTTCTNQEVGFWSNNDACLLAGEMPGLINIEITDIREKMVFSPENEARGPAHSEEHVSHTVEMPLLSQFNHSTNTRKPTFTARIALSNEKQLAATFNVEIFKSLAIGLVNPTTYIELSDGSGDPVSFGREFPWGEFVQGMEATHLLPANEDTPAMVRARNSFWLMTAPVFSNTNWQVNVISPTNKAINDIQEEYIQKLLLTLIMGLLGLLIAQVFYKNWSSSLEKLLKVADQLSASTESIDIDWPRSQFSEINIVVAQLQLMTDSINKSSALQKSEKNKAILLSEIASDWVWETDADLRITYVSDLFLDIVKMQINQVIGLPIDKFIASKGGISSDWRKVRAHIRGNSFRNLEFGTLDSDGLTHYFQVSGSPSLDENGNFLGLLGVGQEITERKKTELAQLRATLAIDNLNQGFALFDEADRLVFSNKVFRSLNENIPDSAKLGTSFEEFLNASIESDVLLPKTVNKAEWISQRLQIHRNPAGPIEIYRQDGKTLRINEQIVPDVGTTLVLTDVTADKISQAQVVQASKLATLGEMATGVAHELNQPLNVIRLAAGNILRKEARGKLEPELLKEKLERISAQTERAARIIDHLRMFGREAKEKPEPICVVSAIYGALDLIGEQLRLEDITINVSSLCNCKAEICFDENFVPEPNNILPLTMGHQVQLEQVFLNLFANSRDAMAKNSTDKRLDITVQKAKTGFIEINVTDSGEGIPNDMLEQLFEPFFTTKDPGKGTGLGLSVSYGIIRDLDGTIEAENVAGGARFIITLLPVKDHTHQGSEC